MLENPRDRRRVQILQTTRIRPGPAQARKGFMFSTRPSGPWSSRGCPITATVGRTGLEEGSAAPAFRPSVRGGRSRLPGPYRGWVARREGAHAHLVDRRVPEDPRLPVRLLRPCVAILRRRFGGRTFHGVDHAMHALAAQAAGADAGCSVERSGEHEVQAWLGLGCLGARRLSRPRIVAQEMRPPATATAAAISITDR